MAQVVIEINRREFKVTCEDGQEQRLKQLAAYFDRHVAELAGDLGQIGDARLMLLAALTICDQLFEAKERAAEMENGAEQLDPETLGAASRAINAATSRITEMGRRLDGEPAE